MNELTEMYSNIDVKNIALLHLFCMQFIPRAKWTLLGKVHDVICYKKYSKILFLEI
mgnify:CR=1 FL=1